ncbi:MAG TPA: hypothetical protein VKR52_16740 [Terracidiphilus sp.]|nr:hypothetical protein [Terracidiphilus sp.]
MRVELPRRPLRPVTFLAGLALLVVLPHGALASDETAVTNLVHTSIVVFADQKLPGAQWQLLFAALRKNLSAVATEEKHIDSVPEFLRGDELAPDRAVNSSILVSLHGDCILIPQQPRYIWGKALGWVPEVRGQIEPFVHIECTHIGELLGPAAMTMSSDERAAAMSEAIARVILHEWVHIATQNSAHGASGITKRAFDVQDLIPLSGRPEIPRQTAKRKSSGKQPKTAVGQ